jgi:uncharacterized protein
MSDGESLERLFAGARRFNWDPRKRDVTLRDRGIGFEGVKFVVDAPVIVRRSDRHGETRYMVFGFLEDVEVVFICTIRGDVLLDHVGATSKAR